MRGTLLVQGSRPGRSARHDFCFLLSTGANAEGLIGSRRRAYAVSEAGEIKEGGSMEELSSYIGHALNFQCGEVEKYFGSPVMSYVGQIHPSVLQTYINAVERLAAVKDQYSAKDRIVIALTTPGGVVETVEKMVEVTRHHFSEVYFLIPMSAMSAGTIFSMSGDKIFMDYTSSLGPIDPQVQNPDGHFVPALGYIDKVDELIELSRKGTITDAELMMLQRLDLATLKRYEQAKE